MLLSRSYFPIGHSCWPWHCRAQVEQKERKAAQRHERLESELNNYKTNLIKESIRMGHNDMGDFFYGRGDLQVYQRAVDLFVHAHASQDQVPYQMCVVVFSYQNLYKAT